jgi:hypothetical protein
LQYCEQQSESNVQLEPDDRHELDPQVPLPVHTPEQHCEL